MRTPNPPWMSLSRTIGIKSAEKQRIRAGKLPAGSIPAPFEALGKTGGGPFLPKNGFAPPRGSPRRRRPVSARTAAVFTIPIPPGGARFPLLLPSAPGCVWASPFPPAAVEKAHCLPLSPPPRKSFIPAQCAGMAEVAGGKRKNPTSRRPTNHARTHGNPPARPKQSGKRIAFPRFSPAAVRNAQGLPLFPPRRGSHSSPRGVRGWRKWRGKTKEPNFPATFKILF